MSMTTEAYTTLTIRKLAPAQRTYIKIYTQINIYLSLNSLLSCFINKISKYFTFVQPNRDSITLDYYKNYWED